MIFSQWTCAKFRVYFWRNSEHLELEARWTHGRENLSRKLLQSTGGATVPVIIEPVQAAWCLFSDGSMLKARAVCVSQDKCDVQARIWSVTNISIVLIGLRSWEAVYFQRDKKIVRKVIYRFENMEGGGPFTKLGNKGFSSDDQLYFKSYVLLTFCGSGKCGF